MASATPSSTGVISFHDLAYLPMKRCLESAIAITKKAQEHLSATSSDTSTGTEEADLVNARLAPDMYAFYAQCYQLQRTTSHVVQRLTAPAGPSSTVTDPPRPADGDVTTLQQCLGMLQAARDELARALAAGGFADDQAGAQTSVAYGALTLPVTKRAHVEGMTLPNMYFHLSIAYAILRMKGVPLGKVDYMTPFFVDYVDKCVLVKTTAAGTGAGAGAAQRGEKADGEGKA